MNATETHAQSGEVILEVTDLFKYFTLGTPRLFGGERPRVAAVSGVSFNVAAGETLGLVGESGCGKSTLARLLVRLLEPSSGSVRFEGVELATASRKVVRKMRSDMQMVFQDPYASLNPRQSVEEIVGEPWRNYPELAPEDPARRLSDLLDSVGLSSRDRVRYPHEFSGGQRQRIGIARALALGPKLIVCDEPVSALDVSVQAQVVNLLKELQARLGLTLVVIAHDLSVVRHIADRVAVMYLGRILEVGPINQVYRQPSHPYTQMLLSAVPIESPQERGAPRPFDIGGEVPSPIDPPSGCHFRTRCWKASEVCAAEVPILTPDPDGRADHFSACHFPEAVDVLGMRH